MGRSSIVVALSLQRVREICLLVLTIDIFSHNLIVKRFGTDKVYF